MSADEQHLRPTDRLTFAGLLGFSTVCVLQLLAMPSLTGWLRPSLYCFAAAIPLLARSLVTALKGKPAGDKARTWLRLFDLVGVLAAVFGFGLIVLQLDLLAGVLFGVCSMLALVLAKL